MGSANPSIDGTTRERMVALVREAIRVGWDNGYAGSDIADLIHNTESIYAWDCPHPPCVDAEQIKAVLE